MNPEAPFTLLIGRRPPSGQKGLNPQFAAFISQEARQRWGTRDPLQGDLYFAVMLDDMRHIVDADIDVDISSWDD